MRADDAKTDADLLKLRRDNWTSGDFWLLVNGDESISFAHQAEGEGAKSIIRIPRADFNKLVRAYMRNQKP